MLTNANHIGWIVHSITDSINIFKLFGYKESSRIIIDEKRGIKIQFIINKLNHSIELIEPIDNNSVIYNLLQTKGAGPYHICFNITKSQQDEVHKYLKDNFFILIKKAEEAIAFNNRKVEFFYNRNIGMIELCLID